MKFAEAINNAFIGIRYGNRGSRMQHTIFTRLLALGSIILLFSPLVYVNTLAQGIGIGFLILVTLILASLIYVTCYDSIYINDFVTIINYDAQEYIGKTGLVQEHLLDGDYLVKIYDHGEDHHIIVHESNMNLKHKRADQYIVDTGEEIKIKTML